MSDEPPRALKFIVISMGIIIVAGFLFVGMVVVQRLVAGDPVTSQARKETATQKAECAEITLPQDEEGEWEWESGFWIYESEHEIRRHDACGKLVQTVKLKMTDDE